MPGRLLGSVAALAVAGMCAVSAGAAAPPVAGGPCASVGQVVQSSGGAALQCVSAGGRKRWIRRRDPQTTTQTTTSTPPGQESTFAGAWEGTYVLSFHATACAGYGCLPGTPGYCRPSDPACQTTNPPAGTCPDFRLTGTVTIDFVRTGETTVRGTITARGAVRHMGPACTVVGRSDWVHTVTGAISGKTLSITAPHGSGDLTLSGQSLAGSILWTSGADESTATETVRLTRA